MQTTERAGDVTIVRPGSMAVPPGPSVRRWRRWAPMIVLTLLVVPVNLLHVARIATISPLDELMHIDYLVRASGPGFLRMSDQFTQEAMNEIACRRHPTQALPPCGDRPYKPEQFSWKGLNLASSHSPYYYVITGVLARPLRAALPGDSLVTWGRVLGSGWLLLGLWVTLRVGRRLNVADWALVPFLALLALSPATQHAATTINPDATCVLAGALVLLATVRALDGSASPWWAAGAALAGVLLDPGNILVVLAALGLAVLLSSAPAWYRRLPLMGLLLAGAFVAEMANRYLVAALGTVDYTGNPQDVLFSVSGLKGPMLWSESAVFALLPPTKGYMFPALSTPAHVTASSAAVLLATVGVIAGAVFIRGTWSVRAVSISTLAVLLVGGPLLVAMRFFLGGTYFAIPARYGLCLVPGVGIAGGDAFTGRLARSGVWLALFALLATTVYALR